MEIDGLGRAKCGGFGPMARRDASTGGLAAVTYLFDGRVMHRDSEGNALETTPGATNLMTAGRGIAHSERSRHDARQGTEGMFRHFKAGSLFRKPTRRPTHPFSTSMPRAYP